MWETFTEEPSLVPEVQAIYSKAVALSQEWKKTKRIDDENHPQQVWLCDEQEDLSHVVDNDDDVDEQASPEYARIVYRIILPLLSALGLCYEILDQIPTPKEEHNNNNKHKHNKKTNAPPRPPIGMLSIQNYTDVACLLEWVVCTTIVPLLVPENVLPSIQERVRYHLPKALAGRIPVASLLWGGSSLLRQQQQQQQPTDDSWTERGMQAMQATVQVVGRLLLLDRFRPMLLPRHLTDLYAALFFVDHWKKQLQQSQQSSSSSSSLYQSTALRLLNDEPHNNKNNSSTQPPTATTQVVVDPHWRARTYQTLLRRGRDAPSWLRIAVGARLSALAAKHLPAVMAVFVHEAAGNDDGSAAALRLARALVGVPCQSGENNSKNNNDDSSSYLEAICDQLLLLLDSVLLRDDDDTDDDGSKGSTTKHQAEENEGWKLQRHHVATLQAVWAVLDLLPRPLLDGYFRHIMVDRDVVMMTTPNNSEGGEADDCHACSIRIHRVVQRFGVLLSVLPKGATASAIPKVLGWFFRPVPVPSSGRDATFSMAAASTTASSSLQPLTLLGAMLRLASTPCIFKSRVKDDALWTLRLFVEATIVTKFGVRDNDDKEFVSGDDALAVGLVLALAPCEWDMQSYTFVLESGMDRVVTQRQVVGDDARLDKMVEGIEHRAAVVVKQILLGRLQMTSQLLQDAAVAVEEPNGNAVLAFMFRILLLVYVSSNGTSNDSEIPRRLPLPESFGKSTFQMVPLVCLPLLCESCPPDALLRFVDGGDGVFAIMRIVFDSLRDRFFGSNEPYRLLKSSQGAETSCALDQLNQRLSSAASVVVISSTIGGESAACGVSGAEHRSVSADDDMLLSLTTILLSLLVGILELGAKQRSPQDEAVLQSFADVLQSLAEWSTLGNAKDTILTEVSSEIAEMASHSLALIASRRLPRENDDRKLGSETSIDPRDSLRHKVLQAEEDLRSTEPPLRARGMVLLRHLANSVGEGRRGGEPTRRTVMLVEDEVEEPNNDALLSRMLQLAVGALKDSESYVYLAAIHTIVAIAQAEPSKIVPVIGNAIATGISIELGTAEAVELSLEQRAKLTEAAVFIIRRRGSFDRELSFLIDLLVLGPTNHESSEVVGAVDPKLIQERTQEYFVKGDEDNLEEYWKEVDIRVRTGGPLFAAEEGDVVRAARINIVCELVSVLSPTVVARYCPVLIGCCIATLRLDATRPVRRSGAALARELYAALIREQESLLDAGSSLDASDVSMAVAMIESREDVLGAVLQRCVDAMDLDDIKAKGMQRIYDPATVARCQEAIDLRHDAERGGIFVAGKLAWESKRRDLAPVARLLRETNENGRFAGIVEIDD